MGMLMNRFNMLTQLRKDIKGDNAKGLHMKQFVLSGVVVHDTNDHALIECIERNFVKWAEMTGDHFLFITFVHPSTDWKQSKHCHDAYWFDTDKLLTDETFSKEDEVRTIPLLREFMDLPQSGSYLVLTDNLASNNFHKIPISAETIEGKFQIITSYCEEEYHGVEHSPSDFEKLLKALNASEFSAIESLIDVLIDFTAVTSYLLNNGLNLQIEQCEKAHEVIEKLRNKMRSYDGNDFEDRLFNLFEFTEIAFTRLHQDNPMHHMPLFRNRDLTHFQSQDCLDAYSAKLYETYNRLSSIMGHQAEDIDYSGLTIYLGKIVENELHLSVGQMLRWALDIEMPRYYNKFCYSKRGMAKVQLGTQIVNLNEAISAYEIESRQKSIPMGTLLRVYKNMYYNIDQMEPEPIIERMSELNDQLFNFLEHFSRVYRNPACHIDPNSQQTYEGAKEAFEKFKQTYLSQLYEIKQSLNGQRQNNESIS